MTHQNILVNRTSLRRTATAWIVFLVVSSLQPLRLRATIQGTVGHFILHVVLFGFAVVIPLLLSGNRAQESARALGVLCLTGGIEIAQGLIYGFHTELRDLEADGMGVLIAFLGIRLWRTRRSSLLRHSLRALPDRSED